MGCTGSCRTHFIKLFISQGCRCSVLDEMQNHARSSPRSSNIDGDGCSRARPATSPAQPLTGSFKGLPLPAPLEPRLGSATGQPTEARAPVPAPPTPAPGNPAPAGPPAAASKGTRPPAAPAPLDGRACLVPMGAREPDVEVPASAAALLAHRASLVGPALRCQACCGAPPSQLSWGAAGMPGCPRRILNWAGT